MCLSKIYYPVLLLLFSSCLSTKNSTALDRYINNLPDSLRLSMQAETLRGDYFQQHRSEVQVPAASVIKVAILIEALRQVEQAEFALTEAYRLQASDKVGGAGSLQQAADGTNLSYRDLLVKMIAESDNTATNILIRRVGLESVNNFLTQQQLTQTSLQRFMMDFAAIAKGRQNYTSASDMNRLLKRLMRGELLPLDLTEEAIAILLQCEDQTTIPSRLPKDLEVAHKTGTLDYVRGDAALIFTPTDTIVLSIFVENFSSFEEAERTIGAVAKLVYEEVVE